MTDADVLQRVRLRPIEPGDEAFLRRLYATTRERELAPAPWSEVQKIAFLDQQFDAQHRDYRSRFPRASFDVVELEGRPVGRLYVDRRETEIRIVDIALLPEVRNRGIGAALMRRVLDEGAGSTRRVTIHVELGNPARRFYERLGFLALEEVGMHALMEWRPDASEGVKRDGE